jgi:hypothetical protein
MHCNELEQILERQADGSLPEVATAHIKGCENCRALTADLEAIHAAAIDLGAEEIAPPERVWITLRHQLKAEGIIHEPLPAVQSVKHGWWFAFQRPALAGAFLSLVLVAAGMISIMGNSTPTAGHLTISPQPESKLNASVMPSAENVFREEMMTVGYQNAAGIQAYDAEVTDSIRRNLNVVDNFIAMCEKDVREQPENEMAREYLYGAYEQKAELLAAAVDRNTMGGVR